MSKSSQIDLFELFDLYESFYSTNKSIFLVGSKFENSRKVVRLVGKVGVNDATP